MPQAIAYLPLDTYPEAVADAAVLAALGLAAALHCRLQVTALSVDVPPVTSPFGRLLLDVEGMARRVEERSLAEVARLRALVTENAATADAVAFSARRVMMGSARDAVAAEARYFDLTLLPWTADAVSAADLAQAVVFGSGRPTILVPASAQPLRPDHLAIAWDESRVAARALGDALALLPEGGRVSVLTVQDEKSLSEPDIARRLAGALERRGLRADAQEIVLNGRSIAAALQAAALSAGAQMLAMGGFGHSRMRDFILGGATKGVLEDLRLPTLQAH